MAVDSGATGVHAATPSSNNGSSNSSTTNKSSKKQSNSNSSSNNKNPKHEKHENKELEPLIAPVPKAKRTTRRISTGSVDRDRTSERSRGGSVPSHRRSLSQDANENVDTSVCGMYGQFVVHPQPPPPPPPPQPPQQQQQQQAMYPQRQRSRPHRIHRRVNSDSRAFFYGHRDPNMFHSERHLEVRHASTKPLERVLSQEELDVAHLPPTSRIRVQSADVSGYGTMNPRTWDPHSPMRGPNSGIGAPPTPPGSSDFSPRKEFMKFSSNFSPTSVSSLPGGGGANSNGGTPINLNLNTSPANKNPALPPVWNGQNGPTLPDFNPQAMEHPTTPLIKRQSSSRKRHMRMKSAQLFMRDIKGQMQEKSCRYVFFALLFYVQVGVVIWLAARFGPAAFLETSSSVAMDLDETLQGTTTVTDSMTGGITTSTTSAAAADAATPLQLNYTNVLKIATLCGIFACTLSSLALLILTIFFRKVIPIALVASIAMAFAWGTIGIGLHPTSFVPVTGVIALAFCIGYTFVVWDRIPFAAANLHTALRGVRGRVGVVVVGLGFQGMLFVWSILWTVAVIGLYDYVTTCGGVDVDLGVDDGETCDWKVNPVVYVGFGISYYWTFQVMTHVVQVTVAGAIGSWWNQPETTTTTTETSCCTTHKAITQTFFDATTYSFGSICIGSLLVGIVQLSRQLAELVRPNRDTQVLFFLNECMRPIQDCVFSCLDNLVSYFNKWAFVYIGLYRYGFHDAGKKSTELLQTRGWTNLATDDLIDNVLQIVSFVIGGCTACFGILMEDLDNYELSSVSNPQVTAFIMGFLIGFFLSKVLLGLVSSSVSTIIICFAESPAEFQVNHPELCSEMRNAWSQVWPGCLHSVPTPSERDLFRNRPWDLV